MAKKSKQGKNDKRDLQALAREDEMAERNIPANTIVVPNIQIDMALLEADLTDADLELVGVIEHVKGYRESAKNLRNLAASMLAQIVERESRVEQLKVAAREQENTGRTLVISFLERSTGGWSTRADDGTITFTPRTQQEADAKEKFFLKKAIMEAKGQFKAWYAQFQQAVIEAGEKYAAEFFETQKKYLAEAAESSASLDEMRNERKHVLDLAHSEIEKAVELEKQYQLTVQ